eukprot:14546669-Heterocapsa_arctica.AAC.1
MGNGGNMTNADRLLSARMTKARVAIGELEERLTTDGGRASSSMAAWGNTRSEEEGDEVVELTQQGGLTGTKAALTTKTTDHQQPRQ